MSSFSRILSLVLCIFSVVSIAQDIQDNADGDPAIVTTRYGKLRGIVTSEGRQFLKVPYATPPVDELRFEPPQALQAWNTSNSNYTYDATQQMPGCYQSPCGPWYLCPHVRSEDCLYMNIYTPLPSNNNDSKLLPVFMFIHGGSFIHYYGGAYVGNSTTLVNLTNTVACLINYRLGAFGYYYNEQLNRTGNYGYYDQQKALRWIKENIAAFGGDPNNIIIGGESAGAQSVTLLTVDASNDALYSGVIVESNPVAVPYRTPESWHQMPTLFVAAAGCNVFNGDHEKELHCLKSRSSDMLLNAQNIAAGDGAAYVNNSLHDVEPWSPTVAGIDGLFPDQPQWLYRDGKFNTKVPQIIGTNRDEFSLFLYAIWNKNTTLPSWELFEFMTGLLGQDNTESAFEYYNISVISNHSEDMRAVGSQMLTDGVFRCASRYLMEVMKKYAPNMGYFYHFNHPSSFNNYAYDSVPACWDEVCHAAELPYVFRIPLWPINVNASYTPDEWDLSEMFQFYWTNLGKYGNPGRGTINNENGVQWLSFMNMSMENSNTMLLDTPPPNGHGVRVVNGFDDAPCDFWDSLQYNWNYA